jgi:hypothetical protein
MAVSLTLGFAASGDKKLSMTFPYASASAVPAKVKTLMQTIIGSGDIFIEPPLSIVDAKFVDRTVTPISLD